MSVYKCNKYLNKIKDTKISSDKFKYYLDKLNYWYNQYGGENPNDEIIINNIINAIEKNNYQKIEYLLNKFKIKYNVPDFRNKKFINLLLLKAIQKLLQKGINDKNTKIIELLIKNGANINYQSEDGDDTILMNAINEKTNIDIINFLIKKGADKKIRNFYSNTAYTLAIKRCNKICKKKCNIICIEKCNRPCNELFELLKLQMTDFDQKIQYDYIIYFTNFLVYIFNNHSIKLNDELKKNYVDEYNIYIKTKNKYIPLTMEKYDKTNSDFITYFFVIINSFYKERNIIYKEINIIYNILKNMINTLLNIDPYIFQFNILIKDNTNHNIIQNKFWIQNIKELLIKTVENNNEFKELIK